MNTWHPAAFHSHILKQILWYTAMETSSNGIIFYVTDHLCGEFTGHRWIPHKGQWRGALMFSLICAWINGWVNNREAGDLRRHCAHYDITVMLYHLQYLMGIMRLGCWSSPVTAARTALPMFLLRNLNFTETSLRSYLRKRTRYDRQIQSFSWTWIIDGNS